MKRIAFAALLLPLFLTGLSAENIEVETFKIITPRTGGMGNAYISVANGFETLWTNPAGFNAKTREFTFLALNGSVLGNIDAFRNLSAIGGAGTRTVLEALKPAILENGAGANFALGFSWVGKNAGFGLYSSFDLYLQGTQFPEGVQGWADDTVALIGGYAWPIPLTNTITLTAGFALRPSLKYRMDLDGSMVQRALDGSLDIMTHVNEHIDTPAFGVPVDLGLRVTFAYGFSGAVTVRDIFATYNGDNSGNSYTTPLSVNAGGAWNPNMRTFKRLLDPTFSVEISNVNRIVAGENGIWKETHLGLELVTLKKALTFWAGLDGGYPAFGAGVDLFIMDISLAYGTAEYEGNPVSNISVEVSFRLD